jgi:hypothetical protein
VLRASHFAPQVLLLERVGRHPFGAAWRALFAARL